MFIINTYYAFIYLVFILIGDNGLLLFIIYSFNDIELLDDVFFQVFDFSFAVD